MFELRAISVSMSVFVLIYAALSILIALAWRTVLPFAQQLSSRQAARFLFSLRVFPLCCALGVTCVFAVPSFLLLEPRLVVEPMGNVVAFLTLCSTITVMFGLGKAARSLLKSSSVIRTWITHAERVRRVHGLRILEISSGAPAMTAAGIFRPVLLLSSPAVALLTSEELRAALRHEFAHVRGHDNLKKLLLRFVAFPGMQALEREWVFTSEMAADESAASGVERALDLASALIKLSRAESAVTQPELSTALVPPSGSVVRTRVERLLAWSQVNPTRKFKFPAWYAFGAALVCAVTLIVTYGQLLVQVHTATEWLVR